MINTRITPINTRITPWNPNLWFDPNSINAPALTDRDTNLLLSAAITFNLQASLIARLKDVALRALGTRPRFKKTALASETRHPTSMSFSNSDLLKDEKGQSNNELKGRTRVGDDGAFLFLLVEH